MLTELHELRGRHRYGYHAERGGCHPAPLCGLSVLLLAHSSITQPRGSRTTTRAQSGHVHHLLTNTPHKATRDKKRYKKGDLETQLLAPRSGDASERWNGCRMVFCRPEPGQIRRLCAKPLRALFHHRKNARSPAAQQQPQQRRPVIGIVAVPHPPRQRRYRRWRGESGP